ncbi:MAG: DEAD/DEAH box helicase [Clostridia bacterium]|nr:DEAD/DEAH box helicase [Clostridia bacterium]
MAGDPALGERIVRWERIPPRPGRPAPWPRDMDGRLRSALERSGIPFLWSHQAEAWRAARSGRHVVVVTPTASGKSLAYNLPVLQALCEDPEARALYVFPTKALARDQQAALAGWLEAAGLAARVHVYDGDTPPEERTTIRRTGQIVITNPDMLHSGILPHHPRWARLFANLRFVVLDELHGYSGVFGSHVANVLRRLFRVARFHGSDPLVLAASATIANPKELAEALVGAPVEAVTESGAPEPERHLLFCNPPLVNPRLGIRRGVLHEARDFAVRLLRNGVATIVFARSRLHVELLLAYIREALAAAGERAPLVHGYRGGYLPEERRRAERDLRSGRALGVVSTNALELGVDIGSLEAAVLAGYPGSVASTWQEWGRAGRRGGPALAVLVASSAPLDQFIVTHPDFFLAEPPEAARVSPDNLQILVSHVKCAAFELPFARGEPFGPGPVDEILDFLAGAGVLREAGGRFHWSAESFPANDVSLRSADGENVVIVDETAAPKVLGEVARRSAPLFVHEGAIYLHEGRQYEVRRLDFAERKAYVRAVAVDYYTDAELAVDLRVLDVAVEAEARPRRPGPGGPAGAAWGEVAITERATVYKKVRLHTHENVGWGRIELPEDTYHTTAFWLTFPKPGGAPDAAPDGRLRLPGRGGRDGEEALAAGLVGVAYALRGLAPLHLLCAPHDLGAAAQVRSPFTGQPTVFLYETVPGGVGFAEKLFHARELVLADAAELVWSCACEAGCPACVGPPSPEGAEGKRAARAILRPWLGGRESA